MDYRRLILKLLTYIFVASIFVSLTYYLLGNWKSIEWSQYEFNYFYLLLSFVFYGISFFLGVRGWHLILIKMGESISFRRAFRILATSQLGRYIPGGIWYSVSRIHQSGRVNVCKSATAASLILETQFVVFGAVFYYMVLLLLPSGRTLAGLNLPAWLVVALLLLLFYPNWAQRIIMSIAKLLKKNIVVTRIRYIDFLKILLLYIIDWGFLGLAFLFLVTSVSGWIPNLAFYIAVSYMAAWLAGFLVLFAPGGLGIREAALTFLLSVCFPLPLAIMFSFLSRIWITVAELILAVVSLRSR